MDILKTKTMLALGISGAMSIGTASASVADSDRITATEANPIIALSSPDQSHCLRRHSNPGRHCSNPRRGSSSGTGDSRNRRH